MFVELNGKVSLLRDEEVIVLLSLKSKRRVILCTLITSSVWPYLFRQDSLVLLGRVSHHHVKSSPLLHPQLSPIVHNVLPTFHALCKLSNHNISSQIALPTAVNEYTEDEPEAENRTGRQAEL